MFSFVFLRLGFVCYFFAVCIVFVDCGLLDISGSLALLLAVAVWRSQLLRLKLYISQLENK